jgi:hypothetical protein
MAGRIGVDSGGAGSAGRGPPAARDPSRLQEGIPDGYLGDAAARATKASTGSAG